MQTPNLLTEIPDRKRDDKPSLLQTTSDALIVCDDSAVVTYMNAQAYRLVGRDAAIPLASPDFVLSGLELPGGTPLNTAYLEDLCRRRGSSGSLVGCKLAREDGERVTLTCDLVAVGPASVLIAARHVESVSDRGLLAYRASHDALTGLPNRAYLQDRLENLHRSAEAQRSVYSLLLIDLDHFKIVNDRFGHATGDRVLAQVGRRIAHNVRDVDTVGRWGGEEFLCLLPHVNRVLAEEIAERIRASLEAEPVDHQGRQIRVTSSIGMATYPEDGLYPDPLLAKADAALYEAKRSGRNRIQSVTRHAGNVFSLANIIERSLQEDRVCVAYQPVLNLVSGEVCAEQAFARIQLENRQLMDAGYFIPAAEQLHLLHLIDHRIIGRAVHRCVARVLAGEPLSAMFVNFSSDFLCHRELVEDILATIKQQCDTCGDRLGNIKPLVIEITERQFIDDLEEAREVLKPFMDMGLRIAIDDFGAGYSSLKYLADLPVSFVKLERSLVRRVTSESRVRSIIQGIQDMAADLGVITVAEGVENVATLESLQRLGVEWGQGYYFSRPVVHS
ncbi:MAG: EAL domain-containing protein [Chromatiaceae bacterium]